MKKILVMMALVIGAVTMMAQEAVKVTTIEGEVISGYFVDGTDSIYTIKCSHNMAKKYGVDTITFQISNIREVYMYGKTYVPNIDGKLVVQTNTTPKNDINANVVEQTKSTSTSWNDIKANIEMTSTTKNSIQHPNSNEPILIERIGNTYYYNNMAMTKKECDAFLAQNNLPIYNKFHNGYELQRKGWTLLGVGLGLEIVGTALLIGSLAANTEAGMATMIGLGATGITIGSCCEIACIPVLAIGYSRMHQSIDHYYVEQKNKQKSLSLNLTASQSGLGLALNF